MFKLKSNVYKFPNNKKKIKELPFGSRIKEIKSKSNFIQFKLGWIKKVTLSQPNLNKKYFFQNRNF